MAQEMGCTLELVGGGRTLNLNLKGQAAILVPPLPHLCNLKACFSPNPEGSWPLSPYSLLLEFLLSSFTSVTLSHVFISFSSALHLNNFLKNCFYSGKFCFFFQSA